MKVLTEKESRRLDWFTWFAILCGGGIVYFFTNPLRIQAYIATLVILFPLINFWVKSKKIPVTLCSVVKTVFLPTAIVTGCAAGIWAVMGDRIMNSISLGLATVCGACIIAIYPESNYADY